MIFDWLNYWYLKLRVRFVSEDKDERRILMRDIEKTAHKEQEIEMMNFIKDTFLDDDKTLAMIICKELNMFPSGTESEINTIMNILSRTLNRLYIENDFLMKTYALGDVAKIFITGLTPEENALIKKTENEKLFKEAMKYCWQHFMLLDISFAIKDILLGSMTLPDESGILHLEVHFKSGVNTCMARRGEAQPDVSHH